MRSKRSSRAVAAAGEAESFAGDRALEETLAPIALAFPERKPPADLWRRIEAAIGADSMDEFVNVRREEGWRQFTRDVQIKRLWDDNTFLLRCAPGGVLPAHKHPRFEHCVVIEGDMIVDGETYRSGDYHGVPAHVCHNDITSRSGLLMLVRYQ